MLQQQQRSREASPQAPPDFSLAADLDTGLTAMVHAPLELAGETEAAGADRQEAEPAAYKARLAPEAAMATVAEPEAVAADTALGAEDCTGAATPGAAADEAAEPQGSEATQEARTPTAAAAAATELAAPDSRPSASVVTPAAVRVAPVSATPYAAAAPWSLGDLRADNAGALRRAEAEQQRELLSFARGPRVPRAAQTPDTALQRARQRAQEAKAAAAAVRSASAAQTGGAASAAAAAAAAAAAPRTPPPKRPAAEVLSSAKQQPSGQLDALVEEAQALHLRLGASGTQPVNSGTPSQRARRRGFDPFSLVGPIPLGGAEQELPARVPTRGGRSRDSRALESFSPAVDFAFPGVEGLGGLSVSFTPLAVHASPARRR